LLHIEMMPTERLVPYAWNARTHSEQQVAQIAASIVRFGFTNPILIGEDDGIIAGHGRLMAAKKLGLADVPTIRLALLNEAERRALVVSDNKIALNAGWNAEILLEQIDLIRADGFDIDELIGFSDEEIEGMLDAIEVQEVGGDGGGDEGSGEVGDGSAGTGSAPASTPAANATLAERFGIPPFTILDARKGWWQDRKRAWLDLGIRSELGRGEGDRACPGGSPLPGTGSRKGYKPRWANAIHDGAVIGKGGRADQVAAAATARNAKKKEEASAEQKGAGNG